MARANTKSINKALVEAGIKAQIHKAPEGYCYFYGDDVEYADSTSVMVSRLSDFTVERWVEEAKEFKMKSLKRKADLDESLDDNKIYTKSQESSNPPGMKIKTEFLDPIGMSVTEAANRLCVTRVTLSRVINGATGISADMAIRLEAAGLRTAYDWLWDQRRYDLACEKEKPVIAVKRIIEPSTTKEESHD